MPDAASGVDGSHQTGIKQLTRATQVFWTEALNTGPTLAVLLTATIVFSLASLFLDTYVITAQASMAVFVVGSYVVFTSYFTFSHYLVKYSSTYRKIEEEKKFYVLSNLIKSAVLLAYSPLAAKTLYQTIWMDHWSTQQIRNLGCMCTSHTNDQRGGRAGYVRRRRVCVGGWQGGWQGG